MTAAAGAPGVDPGRAVAELRELRELTADERGAQRLAWTDTWRAARKWMTGKLDGLPVRDAVDAAGNRWVTLPGERAETLIMGGHLDSVPDGGWLDGALGVVAGLEVLRGLAAEGSPPPLTVRVVDWADEEGARFGYDSLGSSAAAGTVTVDEVAELADADGHRLRDVLAANGVELDRILDARAELRGAAAYLELHIEQGPVLERLGLPLGVVLGTSGVERHDVRFTGQSAHAGSTPMDARHDPLAAAARLALAVREPARAAGAVATVGRCVVDPGIVTAVARECEISLDQRHLDAGTLAGLLARARADADAIAADEGVEVAWRRRWGIEPVGFDPELIELADAAVREVAGRSHRMPSGPLHDAAEIARAGIPTVMLFVQSLRGLSHCREEDTLPEHLELAVRALAGTARRALDRAASA